MVSQSVQNAVSAGNWREAVDALVQERISQNLCFSSGELVAELRTNFPSLSFSARNLGDYVRDLFYAGGMGFYDDGNGDVVQPCQIPRMTQGLGRTPAGQTVFVYGPDPTACQNHDFEVDIPSPPGNPPIQMIFPGNVAVAALPSNLTITGSRAPKDPLHATVHTDSRLCVPRGAFEALVDKLQHVMRGGDPVYICFNNSLVELRLDPQPGYTKYDLSTTRGRVLVTHPSTLLIPGDKYSVTVLQDTLQIDLSQPA